MPDTPISHIADTAVLRRYTFKLRHHPAADAALDRVRRLHAVLYNAALQQRIDAYRLAGRTLTHFTQSLDIKTIRADDPAYEALSADSLSQTLKRLDLAFSAFFRRAKGGAGAQSGFPRFRRAERFSGFSHRIGHGCAVRHEGGDRWRLRIKGIPGELRMRGRLPAPATKLRDVTITQRDGAWWASISVEMPARMRRLTDNECEVTFDLVDQFASVRLADGRCEAGPEDVVLPRTKAEHPRQDSGLRAIACGDPANAGMAQAGHALERQAGACGDPTNAGMAQGAHREVHTHAACGAPANEGMAQGNETAPDAPPSSGTRKPVKRGSCADRRRRQREYRQRTRAANRRKEALHRWTTRLARHMASVRAYAPELLAVTTSGRGSLRDPGALVETKAALNRRMLGFAAGLAMQMLAYKLAERGGAFTRTTLAEPKAEIGNLLVQAAKSTRKLRKLSRA